MDALQNPGNRSKRVAATKNYQRAALRELQTGLSHGKNSHRGHPLGVIGLMLHIQVICAAARHRRYTGLVLRRNWVTLHHVCKWNVGTALQYLTGYAQAFTRERIPISDAHKQTAELFSSTSPYPPYCPKLETDNAAARQGTLFRGTDSNAREMTVSIGHQRGFEEWDRRAVGVGGRSASAIQWSESV